MWPSRSVDAPSFFFFLIHVAVRSSFFKKFDFVMSCIIYLHALSSIGYYTLAPHTFAPHTPHITLPPHY